MRTLALGLIFCCAGVCQEKPDAAELLAKVRANYAKATRFHFVATHRTTEVRLGREVVRDSRESDFAGELPSKGRFVGDPGDGSNRIIMIIVDGTRYFLYEKDLNRYFEGNGAPPAAKIGDLDSITGDQISTYLMQFARAAIDGIRLTDGKEQPRITRDERLSLDNDAVDCWVVETESRPHVVKTWWVDKRRSLVRRIDILTETSFGTSIESSVFRVASVDEPLPASLFKFSPPVGAKRVSQLEDLGAK